MAAQERKARKLAGGGTAHRKEAPAGKPPTSKDRLKGILDRMLDELLTSLEEDYTGKEK